MLHYFKRDHRTHGAPGMKLDKRTQILSGWCAASPEAEKVVFPALVASVSSECDDEWRRLLARLDAPRLTRMLMMARSRGVTASLDWQRLSVTENRVLWDGEPIGGILILYKTTQPYEAQARVAYDIFLDRFIGFIGERYKAIALHQSDSDVEMFAPHGSGFSLEAAWSKFIEMMFSANELKKGFATLVNTIKMTDKGFSALDVPIVTEDQARFLAAFYLVNLESLQKGDEKRRRELAKLDAELAEVTSEKEAGRIQSKIAKVKGDLQKRLDRYVPLYDRVEALYAEFPQWKEVVNAIKRSAFTPMAGVQIAKATGKIGKCVTHLEKLARLGQKQLYRLPHLLATELAKVSPRAGGDSGGKVCYSCGQELARKEAIYEANKFIFESPSQRLQSGGSQTQPKVCGVCAAVSFVSPIKLGGGRLVIRMRERGSEPCEKLLDGASREDNYLVDDQLRMLVLGEMGIVAGKYVLLQARETIGGKPVSERLGGLQYALHRVGATFEPEVFERFCVEALIDNDLIALTNRHLAWLHELDAIFGLTRSEWTDKAQFAGFGRAIRHIQHEEVIFAVYELLKSGLGTLPANERDNRLDKLYTNHVRWLMNDNQTELARFYTDVAAMTGLLYPFCDYVRSEVKKSSGNDRIEVRKVIERSGDPYQVNYTVGSNTGSEMATFFRASDLHFCFDSLKVFLKEALQVDLAEREGRTDKGQLTLRLFFDDVAKAYTYLFGTRYKTAKEQRDFTYALKLSLYARFPEYIESEKKGG